MCVSVTVGACACIQSRNKANNKEDNNKDGKHTCSNAWPFSCVQAALLPSCQYNPECSACDHS